MTTAPVRMQARAQLSRLKSIFVPSLSKVLNPVMQQEMVPKLTMVVVLMTDSRSQMVMMDQLQKMMA